ncbi:MAG: MotE family protein [Syntrophomonadaceae bacterium]|jgi:flagellar protein FlbB
MTNSLKTVKIMGLTLSILAIIACSGYVLVKLGVWESPAVLQHIAVPGTIQANKESGDSAPLDTLQLEQNLAAKQAEMSALQARMAATEQALQQSQESETQLKAEVARLNQEILDLKSGDSAKRAAYKDMAPYFANMKAKDAADILSRLKDEDIIGILSSMEKERAAEILPFMNRDKAAAITAKMLVVGS